MLCHRLLPFHHESLKWVRNRQLCRYRKSSKLFGCQSHIKILYSTFNTILSKKEEIKDGLTETRSKCTRLHMIFRISKISFIVVQSKHSADIPIIRNLF